MCIRDSFKQLLFVFTSFIIKTGSKLHNIGFKKGNINLAGAMPNALYVPSSVAERNLIVLFRRKIKDLICIFKLKREKRLIILGTSSTINLDFINNNSIDYIFVDPPYGNNLMYSELNFLWESWLKVYTNSNSEAIMNDAQGKGLQEYKDRCV